jgi:hypothetical protein
MAIPNNGVWDTWKIDIGMPLFKATNGSEAGLQIWILWSKQSPKFDKHNTRAEWEKIRNSPPTIITKRKIFRIAQEEFGWQRTLKVMPTAYVDDDADLDAAANQMGTIMRDAISDSIANKTNAPPQRRKRAECAETKDIALTKGR